MSVSACLTVKLLPNSKYVQIHYQNNFPAPVYHTLKNFSVASTRISEYANISKAAHIVCRALENYAEDIIHDRKQNIFSF